MIIFTTTIKLITGQIELRVLLEDECNDDEASEHFKKLVSSLSREDIEKVDFKGMRMISVSEIEQVSETDMAGQTLLQHAVAYDREDHVKVLLDKG